MSKLGTIHDEIINAKKIAVDAAAETVALSRTQGIMEVRVTAIEKFMDMLMNPQIGVVARLANLATKFEERDKTIADKDKNNARVITAIFTVQSVILLLLGYLLTMHLR